MQTHLQTAADKHQGGNWCQKNAASKQQKYPSAFKKNKNRKTIYIFKAKFLIFQKSINKMKTNVC